MGQDLSLNRLFLIAFSRLKSTFYVSQDINFLVDCCMGILVNIILTDAIVALLGNSIAQTYRQRYK